MNTRAPIFPPVVPLDAPSAGGIIILIHFAFNDAFAAMFDLYRPGALLFVARGVEAALASEGLMIQGTIGAHGALSEGMLIFETRDRNRAISRAKDFLAACGLLAHCVEIAWKDDAEGILRTCWPEGPTLPFDRHLSEAASEHRNRLTELGLPPNLSA